MHNNSMSGYGATTTLIALHPNDNKSLYYGDFGIIWGVRKPHYIATTLGKTISLLDILITHHHDHPLVAHAISEFGIDEELGMLTRLDNDTAGMVWFARTHKDKSLWLNDQSQGKISKIYEADVIGRIKEEATINTPIMHHRYDDTKMITINTKADTDKGRGILHQVSTHVIPSEINGNNTHIQAIIHQGCRHQIRIHCASHGNPILGERIYHKQQANYILHLRSVGVDRDQLDHSIVIDYQQQHSQIGQK